MNAKEIYQKKIEEAARDIAELCPDCDLHCKGPSPCIPKIIYEKLIEIADFVVQNQWISVEEALPTENRILAKLSPSFCGRKDYLEILHRIPIEMVDLKHPLGYYDCCGENIPTSAITHWMPIPEMEGGEK